MQNDFISYIYLLIVILFLVMLSRKLGISYPIVLVIGGLALGFIPGLFNVEINPDSIFLIFLPPLLYDAAWQTSWKEFWRWRRIIFSFAFLIVIVTSTVVAYTSSALIPGFTVALGFLLGGIISPPDAVSATTIMKGVQVPKRMVSVVEGESLLNDASSLIVFRFALKSMNTGEFVWSEALLSFVGVILLGVLIGLAVALIFYAIHRWLPTTPSIDIVLTFVTPYIMYIAAEEFHASGVLSVVTGGLFLSNQKHRILNNIARLQGETVWSTMCFVLNGLIFILIGLQLPIVTKNVYETGIAVALKYSLIISLILILSRLACTYGASYFTVFISRFIKTADSSPGLKAPLIFGWAGMRGVVSLAAALSIPLYLSNGEPFPFRHLILFITFTVIIVTLVLQGLTLPYLIKWVNMEDPDGTLPKEEQEKLVRKKLVKQSLKMLDKNFPEELKTNDYLINVRAKYEAEMKELQIHHDEVDGQEAPSNSDVFLKAYGELLEAQREALHTFNKKREIDEDIIRKHLSLIDLEETKLKQHFNVEE